MSPLPDPYATLTRREVTKPTDPDGLVLEAWAEGYMVGSLIIMSCITLANMRKGVLLHRIILLELVLGYWQGFFILFNPPIYAWWLSIAAIPLNISWVLHNVIAWMKLKPFLSRFWSNFFISTILLSIPYWVLEIYANFAYFHNVNTLFLRTRPWEALCRDPWWIVAAIVLFYNIRTKYEMSAFQIAKISPRFAVMLGAMMLSIAFIILDVLSVTSALSSALPVGINPFWKLSFVFKCLTDSVVLDDFKTALDRLRAFKLSRLGSFANDTNDSRMKDHRDAVQSSNHWEDSPPPMSGPAAPIGKLPAMPGSVNAGPNGHYFKPEPAEDRAYAGITRRASRDRDIEENGIQEMDYVDRSQDRQASSAPMLGSPNTPSQNNHASFSSDDVDLEYAMALREVTNDDSTKPPLSSGRNRPK